MNWASDVLRKPLERSAYGWMGARSAAYAIQYATLNSITRLLPGPKLKYQPHIDEFAINRLREELRRLWKHEAKMLSTGIYPLEILKPEEPLKRLRKIPQILWDSYTVHRRRVRGISAEFDSKAQEMLAEMPSYYRRNFHFQTSGYLSRRSAEAYDYQVNLLFLGATDAMRRLIIEPIRDHFQTTTGEGLQLLEIGCGTGSATRWVRLALPKARITAVDLSDPYLELARERVGRYGRIDFLRADGADLPFANARFDGVYSVFILHELPPEVRQAMMNQAFRVLKEGGFCGVVDSLQLGDIPAVDSVLKEFPRIFHEPFYRNYVRHPMSQLFEEAGFGEIQCEHLFLGKVCFAKKRPGSISPRAG